MVELTWGDITNKNFIEMLQRMVNTKLPFDTTEKVLAIAKRVNDEIEKARASGAEVEKFSVEVEKIYSEDLKKVELNVGELLSIRPLLADADMIQGMDATDL